MSIIEAKQHFTEYLRKYLCIDLLAKLLLLLCSVSAVTVDRKTSSLAYSDDGCTCETGGGGGNDNGSVGGGEGEPIVP